MMTAHIDCLRSRGGHALTAIAAAMILALFSAGQAHAFATYDAAAAASLSITGFRDGNGDPIGQPGTTFVDTFAEVVPDAANLTEFYDALFTGNDLSGKFVLSLPGAATGNGSATASPGSGYSQSATVSGSVGTGGESLALQLTNGFMTIDNSGSDDGLYVDFSVEYSWLVEVFASSVYDYAEAIASILIDTVVFTVSPEADGEFDTPVDVFEFVATDSGPTSASGGPLFLDFSIFVGAGQTAYIDMFVDAAGYAIPAPAPVGLMLLALAGLVRLRNCKGGHA